MQYAQEILAAMEQPGFDDWRDAAGRDAWDHVLAMWGNDWLRAHHEWQYACDRYDRIHAPEEFEV